MRKTVNTVTLSGKIFGHSLNIKVSDNPNSKIFGQEFIYGDLQVATDAEGINVIPVHYTCVVATYPSGKPNSTFAALKRIINEGKTWSDDGPDEAWNIQCNTQIGVNDFIAADGTLVSAKRAEGGFISLPAKLNPNVAPNHFKADGIFTSIARKEADPDNGIEKEYAVLKGYVFDYRNGLIPADFNVSAEHVIAGLEDYNMSPKNPLFVNIEGTIESSSIRVRKEEERAFGDVLVTYTTRNRRSWNVATCGNPYEFGSETDMTMEEFNNALADREVVMAEVRKRDEDYKASRGTTTAAKPAAAATATKPTAPKFINFDNY